MRKKLILISLVITSFVGMVFADDATAAKKTIALVAVGQVDSNLVERVRAFVDANTAFHLKVLDAQSLVGGGLQQEGEAVAKLLNEKNWAIVALVWPDEDIPHHAIRLQDHNVTVVNVRAMKTEGADDETFARRVERQAMKGIGMMLGMDVCPNPFCAMTQYNSLDELDRTGRNFCPPCGMKLQQKAKEIGVEMDTANPNFMLD